MPAIKRPPPSEASTHSDHDVPPSESGSEFNDDALSDGGSVFGSPSKRSKGGKGEGARTTASSAPSTPRGGKKAGDNKAEPPSSKDFGPEHQAQLNLAIRALWSSQSGVVLDDYPLLAPYKNKGRIHRHFHALMNSAPAGAEGLRLFEAKKKAQASEPGTPKAKSPAKKKAKKEE